MLNLIREHRTFAVLLAIIVLMELAHGIEIVTLLPLYLTLHFGESETFVGLVASAYLFVDTLVTRTPAGFLADRFGRKPTLLVGVVFSVLPLPLMMLVSDPNWFVPLNIVNGLGAGMIWPPIYAIVADLYGRERRGTVLGLINMVMLGGLAAGGPISGSIILSSLGYPNAEAFPRGFGVCILFVIIALVLVALFVRESLPGANQSSQDELRAWAAKSSAGEAHKPRTMPLIPLAGATVVFAILLVIGLLITLALGLIVPILTLFGTNTLQLPLGTFGLLLIPPALTAALVLVPAGHWADRSGRHLPMLLGLSLISIPFLGAALSTHPVLVSAGGMVAALGYALMVPAWNALVMDWIPSNRRGAFLGGIATVQGFGLAVGPLIGGALFQLNPHAPFWTAGILLALGAVFAAILTRQHFETRSRVEPVMPS